MAEHTPAPWTVEKYGGDDAPSLVIHRGETENRICFMATPGSHGDPAMIAADARLIAAAPVMLAALRGALVVLESMPRPTEGLAGCSVQAAWDKRIAAIHAAIAEAGG